MLKLTFKKIQTGMHTYFTSSSRVTPIPVSDIGYRISTDTRQYQWVSVSSDTYLSIGADTSSPVVGLPVSTVNTVAAHTYGFKPILYFCAYAPHTNITYTYLYPTQNRIFSTKKLYSLISVSVLISV